MFDSWVTIVQNIKVTDKKVEMDVAPGASLTVTGNKVKRLPYDHVKISQSTAARLASDRKFDGTDFRVFLGIVSVVEKGNLIVCSQQELSEITGVNRAAISRSLKKLVDEEILTRMGKRGTLNIYMLTPEHGYRGNNARYYETKGQIVKYEIAQSAGSDLAG